MQTLEQMKFLGSGWLIERVQPEGAQVALAVKLTPPGLQSEVGFNDGELMVFKTQGEASGYLTDIDDHEELPFPVTSYSVTEHGWCADEPPERRHPSVENLLPYFESSHLPHHLQSVAEPLAAIAKVMADVLEGPELAVGLRKLLEAKDCFVRAALRR